MHDFWRIKVLKTRILIKLLGESNSTKKETTIPLSVNFSCWVCLEEIHEHVNLILKE